MITITQHSHMIESIEDEGGRTVCVHHSLTTSSGRTLAFSERNVFDFGRVINPDYAIAPGKERGGLYNRRADGTLVWMDFQRDSYRLPDGRTVDYESALDWALSTLPPGLPDGYRISDRLPQEEYPDWLPPAARSGVLLYYPADETWFGADCTYHPDPESALQSARQFRAFNLIKPFHVQHAGWIEVRPLDPDEIAAVKYLQTRGHFAGAGVRMDAGDDTDRIDRQEAALELACESGLLAGAMPADL